MTAADARASRRWALRRVVVASLALVVVCAPAAAQSGRPVSRSEALASVYPGATIEAERVFLTGEQQTRAAAISGAPVSSALVARYVARHEGHVVGRAYVDTHQVRTKRESLLISLDAEGRLRRIDVTAFLEPPEYQASPTWLRQFEGHERSDELHLQRAIRPIAGATLTARAVAEAARRVLAIDRVLTALETQP